MANTPGFEIDVDQLIKSYEPFYKIVGKPGLWLAEKDEKSVGSISSHLYDDICTIYSLAGDLEVQKVLLQETMEEAQQINNNALATYVGSLDEFEKLFKPFGFNISGTILIYTSK